LYVDNFDLNFARTKLYASNLFFAGKIRGWPRWIKFSLISETWKMALS
jgi:hypothetical protein